ncbi:MAG: tetratricopeptide repeat protein [Ardenticatenaceae bacterium]|nr:tetratricopeptide repeat protein [Ardenticatenaceae bacterium]
MTDLADVLSEYVNRSGYTTGQLAKLTAVPKPTIVNWLEGRVKRPRDHVDLLRLAAVLHLTDGEMTQLLDAAGHPPLPELRAQAQQSGDSETLSLLSPWAESTTKAPGKEAPFQVTADLPYFVGRKPEMAAIQAALLAETHTTLYSVQGMGGIGKTALAVHLAYVLRPYFPDGVLWAKVDISDTMSILRTFAQAYGVDVSAYGDIDSRSRLVRDLLADKRALLVLDNVQTSEQVQPLLPPTGRCAVLITTRRHDLAVLRRAQRFEIRPFPANGSESLDLFRNILGAERVTAEAELLRELAALLGHLPLALDIAASRLAYEPGWSTADFLQRIRQQQRRLAELSYEDQSVRLSFDASFAALTTAQQQFLTALSLFHGEDFSDAAAAYVADLPLADAQDALRQLYGLSLVQAGRRFAGQATRYQLHPLLRDYVRRHLSDAEEATAVTRLITYFVTYAQTHHRDDTALEQEQANILAALQLAQETGHVTLFVQGVNAFYYFWETHGLYQMAANYLTAVTAIPQDDPATQLAITHHRGRLAQRQGEYIDAETLFEAGLELARRLDDQETLSHLLRASGVLAARRGDYVLADAYYKEGLALARALGHGGIVSDFLRGLGVQAYVRGDFARAEAFYEEGLALMHQGDETAVYSGGMLWGLGVLAQEQGDNEQAEAYYRQALALARQQGHQERIIVLWRSLGNLHMAHEQYDQAAAAYEQAAALAQEIGHRWQYGRVLSEWGELQLWRGEWETAVHTFSELFHQARILQSQELIAYALYGQARVAVQQKEIAQALAKGREALDTLTAIGHHKVQEIQMWLQQLQQV